MAAADKLNGAYWRKRAIELAEKQKREDDDLCLRFHREYERILHELDKELSIFYARYAANESVSMADARRLLRDAELEDFRMSLDEFRDKALAGGFDKELEEVYLRSRISRLQALQTQVELRMMELFGSQRDVLRDHLQERYTDTYYRTVYAVSQQADVASTFARIDPQTIERILAVPWVGSEFSSRIWADKDKLTRELMQTLSRGFVRGDSLGRMTKEFAQRMGVSESRAATLIHTESAYMAAEAAEQGYRETGVQSYRFEAALDLKTCAVCGALDQREFPLAEHETGINYPPLHPRCRCTTVPVTEFRIGSKRAARNPATGKTEYVEKKLTYEEWRKKYVENTAENDIMELQRKAERKTANTGSFAELQIPLQKREVLRLAKQYGVDMRGITVKIQRSEKLLALPLTGSTDYKNIGRIDLFPRAFENEEQLMRTLIHEKCHVKQLKKHGAAYAQKNLDQMERQAYRFESFWYQKLRKKVQR
jgi:SPP1 gp7 family putative phage head morphogenesis protein